MSALSSAEPAAPIASESVPLSPGRRLGDFLITRIVGQGGFGIVYEAEDLTLQRRVAIKEYMPAHLAARIDDAQVHPVSSRYAKTFALGLRSFLTEARLLAQFRNPGLLEVLHFWEQNGTAYMVMPFYEGRTLDQVLANGPAIVTEPWLKSVIRPVLDALEHMHASDCFHRDVAADNILIRDGAMALLLDLGAARRVIGDSERALTVMLKPGYAPIEQYADDPACRQGPWTDIYAVAAVLYFAVTTRMPPASASRVMHDSLPALGTMRPPGYSKRFLEAIDRGLAIRPEQRPRTIGEFRSLLFAAELEDAPATAGVSHIDLLDEEGDALAGNETAPRPRRRASLTAWLAGAGAIPVAGLLGAAALAWFVVSWDHDPAGPSSSAASLHDAEQVSAERTERPAAQAIEQPVPSHAAAADDPAAAAQAATHPIPAAGGTLRLSVVPWGEVIVDDVSRGVTPPLKQLPLSAGRHRIEIRNPASPTWTKEVVVEAGERTTVSHRFQ